MLPGASEPDWGPAGVVPAPRPAPVTPVTPATTGQRVTPPVKPGAKRACAAKPTGKARRRCRALRTCTVKPTKRAAAACAP